MEPVCAISVPISALYSAADLAHHGAVAIPAPIKVTVPPMRKLRVLILSLSFLPLIASAHHAGASVYDPLSMIEIEGEVTRVLWRNPHVRLMVSVTDADGNAVQWKVEGNSVSTLSRMGLTAEVINVGDRLRIAGWPARRPVNEMFAINMLLPGATQELLLTARATPRWSDDTLGNSTLLTSDGQAATAEDAKLGIFRVWSTNMANPASFPLFNDVITQEKNYPLTDSARAARESWDSINDNPYLGCTPMGMPRVMGQPYPIEFVDNGDAILLRIELYDIERVILMNTTLRPEDVPASPLGHSVGRWENETLVVTTNRVNWRFFDQSGVPLGDTAEIIERYTPSRDGNQLDFSLSVTDPATFTEPVTLEKYWTWRQGEEVQPFECTGFDN